MMRYFFSAFVIVLSISVVLVANAGVWDTTYEGTTGIHGAFPGSTNASLIDDHARNMRQQVRKRLDVEHHVGGADGTADDNGLHRLGSARCFMADEPPDELNDSHSSATNINDYDNTDATAGVSDLEDSASTSAGNAEDDVGHGRCWIDTNDGYQMYIYVGTAADDTPSTATDGWIPIGNNGSNLILHGDFETADGDGDSTSTTIPSNWTLVGTNTFAYTTSVQGDGLAVVSTVDAADTLAGLETTVGGLRASTWYIVRADVNPSGAGDCRLNISDEARTYPSGGFVDNTGASGWETLWIAALTDASAPESLDVELLGVGNSDECDWDNVRMYRAGGGDRPQVQMYTGVPSASTVLCNTSYDTDGCNDLMSIDVHAPEGQSLAMLTATTYVNGTSGDDCYLEIHDGTSQVVERLRSFGSTNFLHMTVSATVILTPGTTTTFTVRGRDTSGDDCTMNLGSTTEFIQAVVVPAGG